MASAQFSIPVAGKRCLVIGGCSKQAEKLVEQLLSAGALVTVQAYQLTANLGEDALEKRFKWLRRELEAREFLSFELMINTFDDADSVRPGVEFEI